MARIEEKQFSSFRSRKFWRLCCIGRELFWKVRNECIKEGWSPIKKVPAYERAIMMLEHEGKFEDPVRLCKDANRLGIDTDWYNKRIKKLENKL